MNKSQIKAAVAKAAAAHMKTATKEHGQYLARDQVRNAMMEGSPAEEAAESPAQESAEQAQMAHNAARQSMVRASTGLPIGYVHSVQKAGTRTGPLPGAGNKGK